MTSLLLQCRFYIDLIVRCTFRNFWFNLALTNTEFEFYYFSLQTRRIIRGTTASRARKFLTPGKLLMDPARRETTNVTVTVVK